MITAKGDYKIVAIASLFGVTVFTISVLPLFHTLGVLGIIYALGAGLFSINVVQILKLHKTLNIDFDRAIIRPLGVVLLSSYLSSMFVDVLNQWILLVLGLFAMLFGMFVGNVIKENEVMQLRQLLNKIIR